MKFKCKVCGGTGRRHNYYHDIHPEAPESVPYWGCDGRGERAFTNNGMWRTARKQHECWHCKNLIEIGDTYWEDYNETPAFQSGTRYCERCVSDPDSPEYGLASPRQMVGVRK